MPSKLKMARTCLLIQAWLSVLFFVATKGIKDKKEWAKIVAIVLAAISLTNVPVGTILGILILIGVLDEESNNWFIPTTE